MKTYSYRSPATTKPPAAISYLGRVVRGLPTDDYITSRELFRLAFAPHENFDCCKATFVTAQARGYVEKAPDATGRNDKYRLTDNGAAVRRAIEAGQRR